MFSHARTALLQTQRRPADKRALAAALTQADELTESNYTLESWALLVAAVQNGNAVIENVLSRQSEVDSATAAITAAMAGLVVMPAFNGIFTTEIALLLGAGGLTLSGVDGHMMSATQAEIAAGLRVASSYPTSPAITINWPSDELRVFALKQTKMVASSSVTQESFSLFFVSLDSLKSAFAWLIGDPVECGVYSSNDSTTNGFPANVNAIMYLGLTGDGRIFGVSAGGYKEVPTPFVAGDEVAPAIFSPTIHSAYTSDGSCHVYTAAAEMSLVDFPDLTALGVTVIKDLSGGELR